MTWRVEMNLARCSFLISVYLLRRLWFFDAKRSGGDIGFCGWLYHDGSGNHWRPLPRQGFWQFFSRMGEPDWSCSYRPGAWLLCWWRFGRPLEPYLISGFSAGSRGDRDFPDT